MTTRKGKGNRRSLWDDNKEGYQQGQPQVLRLAVFAKCANTFAQDDRVPGAGELGALENWNRESKSGRGWFWGGLVVFALHIGHGVVAFAGLDFLALLAVDVEGAEGTVRDLGFGGAL